MGWLEFILIHFLTWPIEVVLTPRIRPIVLSMKILWYQGPSFPAEPRFQCSSPSPTRLPKTLLSSSGPQLSLSTLPLVFLADAYNSTNSLLRRKIALGVGLSSVPPFALYIFIPCVLFSFIIFWCLQKDPFDTCQATIVRRGSSLWF